MVSEAINCGEIEGSKKIAATIIKRDMIGPEMMGEEAVCRALKGSAIHDLYGPTQVFPLFCAALPANANHAIHTSLLHQTLTP